MKPFLHGGETVVMRRVSGSSLVRGDLVFYKDWNGITTLHRIIRKYEDKGVPMIQTKGDALISLDEPISADQILGKVCLIEGKCSKDMESMKWKGINYSLSIIHLMKSVTNRASGSCRTLFRYVFAKKFFGNQG